MRFLAVPFLATLLAALPVSGQTFTFNAADETVEFHPDDGIATFETTLSIAEIDAETGAAADTGGFQMAIAHDPVVLDLVSAEAGADLEAINDGAGPGFFGPDYSPDNGDGLVLGVVYSLTAGVLMSFDVEKEVVDVTYDTVPTALIGAELDVTTDLTWTNDMGNPVIINSMVVDGQSVLASGTDATITLHPVQFTFLRGDVNGNGDVWALIDALFMLDWSFLNGDAPPCMDAADADDSGGVQSLVDATFLLAFAFLDGDAPPAPGIDLCGEDPTDDALDCLVPLENCD